MPKKDPCKYFFYVKDGEAIRVHLNEGLCHDGIMLYIEQEKEYYRMRIYKVKKDGAVSKSKLEIKSDKDSDYIKIKR